MGLLGATEFNSLQDLFEQQMADLYDAEKRLTEAIPKMSKAAHAAELKQAFDEHLTETKGHIKRLDEVFKRIGKKPSRETCEAMKGLIKESEEMVEAKGNEAVRDAALIAAAQRVEHYEIAGYGTLRSFAQRLGLTEVAQMLQMTLDEEGNADQRLTRIAESTVNPVA